MLSNARNASFEKNKAEDYTAKHDYGEYNERLTEHHEGDMLLIQSKNAVEAQFLFPALDKEAVGVDDKGKKDYPQQYLADGQKHQGIYTVRQYIYDIIAPDGCKHKEYKNREYPGHDIRTICGAVFAYPHKRQLWKQQELIHFSCPLSAGLSEHR
jgi:hypothetical protein